MSERLLCIIAHPDDETIFAGGILAMFAEQGLETHILSATRGEGGEMGAPPIVTRDRLGVFREQELRCAAQALGVQDVRFLEYVDPLVGENDTLFPYTDDLDELAGHFSTAIERLRPAIVLTHGSGGEYGHPAHVVTHAAVVRAHSGLRAQGIEPYLYTFSAVIPGRDDRVFNLDDPAHLVVDVTPWMDAKSRAAECHRTQHALFFRRHPEAEIVLDVMRTLESLHRVWPIDGPDHASLRPYRLENRL